MSIYNKEYAKKVYAGLLKRGYTSEELGDEVKFVERMGKESNRRILYDVVQQRNNANIGSWERFNGRMSSPSPVNESSYTFTEQELKEKFGPEENDDPVVPMSHVFQFGMAPVSMAQATSNAGGGRAEKPLTSLGNPYDEKRYSGFSRREIEWLANQPEEVRREQISDDVLMAQMEKIAREDIDTEELKYQLSELSVKTGAELERYAQERGAKQAQEEEKKPLWRRVLENMPKGGGVASTPDYVRDNASIIGDARWNTLKAADSLNKESQSIIEAAEKDKGFVGGMANKLSDIETWLPMLTAMKSSEILQLVDKFEKGEELTKDEENLLDALAVNVVVKLAYESDVSNAYSAGQSVAEMPGFMAEMVINPLSGASNMLVSRLGKYAVKKGIGAAILRAGAKAVGATAAGAGMAVTTGLPRTAADAMNRMAGQADYEIRDGKVEYAGQVNRESALEAGYKAVAEGAIQNASEMLGAEWVTKGVATVGKKVLGKSKAGREVLKALDAIENSSAGKAVKAFQNATKWNGTVEEFIEEIEAGVGSAVFVGDQEIKDVFDKDNLATTFLAVLAPGVTMGAVQTAGAVGGYYTERYRTSRDLNRARREVEELMGEDAAEYIDALDSADENTMNAILAYVDESELPKEQKIAIMKYAAAKLKSDVSTSVLDVLATEEDVELEAAFTQGAETEPTPENKQVARTALLRAEEEMRSRLGWDSEADIELFLREHSAEELAMGDEQTLRAINNYKREKAFVEGMRASIQDRREERYAEVDKSIDKNANKVDGNVYSTTYNGEEVFITGGNVVLNDNGAVDYDASSDALYITFSDGHTEQVAAKNFAAAVNTERAEDLKAAKHLEIDSELNAELEANEQQGAPAENGNVTAENGAAASVEQENNSVAPVVDKKVRRAELEALIPIEGKKKQFTKVEPAVTAEYIQMLTDDVAKQIATADKYIANIQAAQEKADPIEALEMDEQIAYWESVKALLAPQESVSEVAEASPVAEETQAPVVESAPVAEVKAPQATNEMQPVSEEGVHPTIAAADEGRDTVGGSPVALAYLLEGGEGSILNAGYFLHGVAAAFPAVSSEIEVLRGAMSGDVLGMNPTEFVAQRADEIAQIGELITNAYGDAGAAIYNELLNNASGFVPRVGAEVGARIEALQPLNESTLSQTSDQVGEQVAEGGNTPGNGGVVDNNNARDVLERAQAAQEADPEIAENEGENSTLEQIKAELGPLNRDNAAEYARRLFAISPWKTLEEANVVLKELLASYGETLSGQTLGVVPFLDEAHNLIIDNDIAELKEQNRVADERQQRIGLPPRVSDYSKAIAEGNAEAMKEWEGGFDDYLNKLLPADIPALDSTVRNMQGNKDAIKTGDPKGYKENPNYKAFDYIEKALKKRKKEIEESSINGEKSQEVEEKSTNNGENVPITTEDLVRMVREGAMRQRVAKWSKLLGVDIILHESTESVTNKDALDAIKEADANGQYVKGWFDGKGHIYLPHNINEADVDATVLHEIVAHLGIKEMLTPEQWDVFRDKVWEMMSEEARAEKLEYIGADPNNPTREQMRAAADEYVAELAENIKLGKELNAEEKNIWQKIVEFFKGIFAEKLNAGDILSQDSLTDADIANMVLASFENLKKKGGASQATGQGETMARKDNEGTRFSKKELVEIKEANKNFNEELQRYQIGAMSKNEIFTLGVPQGVLKKFLANLPIVMTQKVVRKGILKKHHVDLESLKDMPSYIADPIFVFQRADGAIGILTEITDTDGKNVCVAIDLSKTIQRGGDFIVVNDIRSFHGREIKYIIDPIVENGDALKWVNKKKGLSWLSSASQQVQQEIDKKNLSSAAKIVESFDNSKIDEENSSEQQANPQDLESGIRFRITPEMDAEYISAVENGDMETAERLVKEAAKLAMPDTKVVDEDGYPMPMFHGDRKKGRYVFSTDTFFTPNEQYAKRYTGGTGEVYPVYLNIENPFDVRDEKARDIFTEFNGGRVPVETTTGALDWGQYTYEDLQEYIEENYPGEYDGFILDEGGEPDYNGNVVHRGLSYIPFTSSQAKYSSAVTYDDNGNVIPLSERFNEEKEDIRFRRANKNQEVFVSNAQRAVEGIKQEKATPEQWIAMLKKNGGLKAGEDKWLGLEEWLNEKQGAVTKQEILDFIGENKIQIEEVEYAGGGEQMENYRGLLEKNKGKAFTDRFLRAFDIEYDEFGIFDEQEAIDLYNEANGTDMQLDKDGYWNDGDDMQTIIDWAESVLKDARGDVREIHRTRIQYTTEGLENKREIALTVPTVESYNIGDYTHFGDAGNGRAVAWVRFGETTDSEGNRVLVIDEIQSKRHQDGREKGYRSNADKFLKDNGIEVVETDTHIEFYKNGEIDKSFAKALFNTDIEKAKNLYVAGYEKTAVPSAPFEKNWHELAMKRMLRLAAEEGFDKVAWTTGEQQAERYDIGRSVELIQSEDNNTELFNDGVAVAKDIRIVTSTGSDINFKVGEDGVIRGGEFAGRSVSEVFGKDFSTRIMNPGRNTIEGDGLRIGGEGMKGFYDRMLPSFVQKYTKKWGAKVGTVEMPSLEQNNVMHSVDVTPEMKESVMEGQTMFRFIGKKGAVNLDKAEEATTRLDNLNVAREMESAGKDAKTIKLATGWERGADGKWRYETEDAKVNREAQLFGLNDNKRYPVAGFIEKGRVDIDGTVRLDKLIDDEALFDAYPGLREYYVTFEEMEPGTVGSHNYDDKVIRFNRRESIDKLTSTLNHEIQHAVQHIEGFALGSNVERFADVRGAVLDSLNFMTNGDLLNGSAISDVQSLRDALNKKIPYTEMSVKEGYADNLQKVARKYGYENIDALVDDFTNMPSAFEQYRRTAGEVESRNVQERMGMTPEERRNSLAEETADVAKEDQIFLFENQGTSAMMGSRVDARMAQVASELDTRELSPEQRAVADVFGGKADNLTISVKTKEGNERKVVMRQGNEAHAGTKHSLYRHYNTGSGAITTDDILLIPEILANGERTENKRGNTKLAVYRLTDGNGTRYTVVTEVKEKGEVFNDFYTNKKASNQTPQMPIGDTQSSARTNDSNAPSADKGNSKSSNEQATDEILSQQDGDEVAMTKGAINALGEKLNTPMKILEDTAGLDERQKKAKGWYDTKTGEVVIVLPNNISLDDVIETVLHELVGHKGLRGVMGEAFDSFLDFVYENAAPEMKRAIDYRFLSSIREGKAMTLRECTEEYIASLAERGFDGYNGVWNAIKQWLRNFFRRFANVNVSDGELRYMLWKSYNRLQRGPIAEIEDIAMEDKTNTGDRANRFREVANDGISNRYDQRVEGIWNQFKEGWMDATRSMKVAQEEIQKEVGRVIVDTADFFNFTNTVPSRNRNKMDRFEVQLMNPFLKFLGRILTDKDISEKDLERYANAKHGIERNREMAVKEAMYDVVDGKRVFNAEAYEEYKKRKGAILTNGKSWIEQQNELDALATSFGATIKDYSGFTSIFAPDKEVKYTDLRKAAVAYVAKMEAELGEEDTKTLWKHIGDINGFSQNEALESGRISKEVFDANAQRYQYYVPLRGFTETTADEMYDYVSEQKSVLNSAQKRAQGRKSEANNIFATMLNIANSEIIFGNKNLAKQRLLNCALLYKTNLLSVGEAWYEKGDNNEYSPIYPNINDAMSNEQIAAEVKAFEERCKEREQKGEVTRKRQGVELKYKSPDKWNKSQHAVSVMRNGREYTVYVNGSPRLAQAMNGLLMEQDTNKFFNVTDAINRFRAKMVTGYSPKFVVTNGVRDIQESTAFFFAKYGVSVAKKFSGNVMKIMPEIHRMFRLYEKNELDMNNEMHRYFKEFLENGGETGYSAMISIQEYEKKINDNIKAKSVLDMSKGALESAQDLVEFANRGVENVCRFAAYMTSRENGLSVLHSVVDAKNVSVNFNRKGSGAAGNLEARKLFMFLNPAVQSLVRRVELTRKYPKRMAMVWATELALGAALPVIWNVVYDLLGGDDDEALNNYYNLSDFTRRANLCIPLSNGVVKIPLSHEARVLYSLGEVITSAINGHSEYDNVTADVINSFAQILPLNPMEGWAPGDNIGEALAMNLSPDAMKFFTEILLNKDFAGNRIHDASDFNKHKPERLRGKRGTAKVYQMVSDILSGDYERNFFDEQLQEFLTPSSIEHIVKSYLGGMYSTANELIKTAQWIGGDEEYAEFKNVPIANAFYQSLEKYEAEPGERTRRDWEKAYQNFFEVVGRDYDTEKTVKGLIKNGDVEALSKLQEMENRGELLRIDIFNDGQKRLEELYEEKDAARNMKDYTLSDEIDKRIYAMKRELVTRMETLADDPMSGYLMLTERDDSEYGVRETYGDARDVNIINEFQRSIKPIIDGAKQSENRTKYTNAYSKEFEIWRILKRCEDGISKRKKSMENNPDECDRYMMEIRKLRADAVKLINEYE